MPWRAEGSAGCAISLVAAAVAAACVASPPSERVPARPEAGAARAAREDEPEGTAGDGAGGPPAGAATGSGGGAPASPLLHDDDGVTAPGFVVTVHVLDNDERVSASAEPSVAEPPGHGTAAAGPQGTLEYAPSEGFTGRDSFSYVVGPDVAPARVSIDVVPREWVLVGDAPFTVQRGPSTDAGREPDTQRWTFVDASETHVFGYFTSRNTDRAFVLPRNGEAAVRFLDEGPSRAEHVSSLGVIAGSVAFVGTLWEVEGARRIQPAWAAQMELTAVNAAGMAVGRRRIGSTWVATVYDPTMGPQPLAFPAGAEQGTIYGLNDAGVMAGSVVVNGTEVAAIKYGDEISVVDKLPTWRSRAYDVNNEKVIVGEVQRPGQLPRGFMLNPGGDVDVVHLRSTLSTRLQGVSEGGTLVGTVLDPLGYQVGFVASPDSEKLAPRSSIRVAPDAPNAGVDHACVHSMEGPFRVLNASEPAAAGDFHEPHMSYTLMLSTTATNRFRYGAPGAEHISFFVDPPVPLRLYDPNGALVPASLARSSSLCAKIQFVYQFEVMQPGTHTLVVDPTPTSTSHVIFERSWSYPP